MILGITGRIASGKGVAAQYFHEHGYNYYTLSTEVREEASRRQLPITREQLQYLGNDLREKEGPDIWMKKIYENQDFSRNSIIDGLRNPAEIEYLKNLIKPGDLILVKGSRAMRLEEVVKILSKAP